jgi:hypothetical protein
VLQQHGSYPTNPYAAMQPKNKYAFAQRSVCEAGNHTQHDLQGAPNLHTNNTAMHPSGGIAPE